MDIINFLKAFMLDYGITSVIVLVLTVVFTNLVKIPFKKHAKKIAALASKSGFNISESFISGLVIWLPWGVSFVLFCIVDGITTTMGGEFSIVNIFAKTPVIALTSMGLYSMVTNWIESRTQKKDLEEYKKSEIQKTNNTETENKENQIIEE